MNGWEHEPHVPTASTAPPPHVLARASRSRSGLPAVLVRIRSCESGPNGYATDGRAADFDYSATNPRSSASGAWQVLRGTWNRYGDYPTAGSAPRSVQDSFALKLWREQGTVPWRSSAVCWGRS